MAGISLRRARSPTAPKMIAVQGSPFSVACGGAIEGGFETVETVIGSLIAPVRIHPGGACPPFADGSRQPRAGVVVGAARRAQRHSRLPPRRHLSDIGRAGLLWDG